MVYKCYNCPHRKEVVVNDSTNNVEDVKKKHQRNVMSVENGVFGQYSNIAPFWCPCLNSDEKIKVDLCLKNQGQNPYFEEL